MYRKRQIGENLFAVYELWDSEYTTPIFKGTDMECATWIFYNT